ncbi:hypothetical protein J5N97_018497 [Dioscorea zingiberensis]|uniref:Uncharacterized protein n=1 Tax=Dioscorea zingiberensis TaxID=325984 RepID=A0A9D5CCY2_9LILI|nr:hypothetical protein J5N97_018497 [Dioscorea zingiberensis]
MHRVTAEDLLESIEQGEEGSGHRPKRVHRQPPPLPDGHGPRQVGVGEDRVRRRIETVEKALEGFLQLGVDGIEEAAEIAGAAVLGGDEVGDGSEPGGGGEVADVSKPSHSSVTTAVTKSPRVVR